MRTCWTPLSSMARARASVIIPPASTMTSSSMGSITASAAMLPATRSDSGSMMSSPSLSAVTSSPRIVLQSSSMIVTSCATSTSRRVR